MAITTIEAVDLHYLGGGSDKVYHLTLAFDETNYIVAFAYGRRGARLTEGSKYTGLSASKARTEYDKVYTEKTGKGYHVTGGRGVNSYPAFGGTAIPVSAPPKATKAITAPIGPCLAISPRKDASELPIDTAQPYLEDDAWCAQEKFDGERLRVLIANGTAQGYSRKGTSVPLSIALQDELQLCAIPGTVLLDGERVGDVFRAFDCIQFGTGYAITKEVLRTRRERLFELLGVRAPGSCLQVVRSFEGLAKARLFAKVAESRGEGVVFKRLDSLYTEGRCDDWVKVKFVERATCIVVGHNDVSSIQLGLLDSAGAMVDVGNVTVATGRPKPPVGSLVEVEYLYAYEGGSLYQPVLIGPRTDIEEDACVVAQLKFKPVLLAA